MEVGGERACFLAEWTGGIWRGKQMAQFVSVPLEKAKPPEPGGPGGTRS